MSSDQDIKFVLDGLTTLLNNAHQSNNTQLPRSMKRVNCFQEVFVLLWKLIDENEVTKILIVYLFIYSFIYLFINNMFILIFLIYLF